LSEKARKSELFFAADSISTVPDSLVQDSSGPKQVDSVEDFNTEDPEDVRETTLENEFDRNMSLLWDITSEKDVIMLLLNQNIFKIIETTIASDVCNRLNVSYIFRICLIFFLSDKY